VVAAKAATARRFNHDLLFCTAGLWLCYLLVWWVPLRPGAELLRGVLRGCFVCALIWGTNAAALAAYGAVRYRYRGYFLTALLAAPLSALCWYHLLYWPIP
jgi:hypothetical protein